jgi:hypothetical protein
MLMLLIWFFTLLVGLFRISLNSAVMITDPLGVHIRQYIAQLGEAGSNNSLRIRLFSLSLTETTFSWFSSLAPNWVHSWNE